MKLKKTYIIQQLYEPWADTLIYSICRLNCNHGIAEYLCRQDDKEPANLKNWIKEHPGTYIKLPMVTINKEYYKLLLYHINEQNRKL